MIEIKGKALELPLIQGGMGIGVSLGGLAGHVAACGGMGVISTANPGYLEEDFWEDPLAANLRALRREVAKAREIAGGRGLIAVNAMVATSQYAPLVEAAIRAGADGVISGAGLPTALPGLAGADKAALAPIVSSAKAARTICRLWDKRYGRQPDFVVVEGPLAGGHLGFGREELLEGRAPALEEILPGVLLELQPFAEKAGRAIPVFAAGGVYSGRDLARFRALGAAGVQIATRFIATAECDAAPGFKEAILRAREEDAVLIQSPVGMPGRALSSPLIRKLASGGRIPPRRCIKCLLPCRAADTPYCITQALIQGVKGNWQEGLFFCGANVGRTDRLTTVAELIEEIMAEERSGR